MSNRLLLLKIFNCVVISDVVRVLLADEVEQLSVLFNATYLKSRFSSSMLQLFWSIKLQEIVGILRNFIGHVLTIKVILNIQTYSWSLLECGILFFGCTGYEWATELRLYMGMTIYIGVKLVGMGSVASDTTLCLQAIFVEVVNYVYHWIFMDWIIFRFSFQLIVFLFWLSWTLFLNLQGSVKIINIVRLV